MAKVSVVMPVFNAERFVREAIESVLSQTYEDLELIIIDDFSTDNSFEIVSDYLGDERVRLFKNSENRGISYSLNLGIAYATGAYIARMDADDICLPNRLAIQVAYLEKYGNIDILGANCRVFDENGIGESSFVLTRDENIKAYLFVACPFIHPTMIFRRSYIEQYQLRYKHSYYRAEDYGLWAEMMDTAIFANLNNCLLYYRIVLNSETRLGDREILKKLEVAMNIHRTVLAKVNVSLSDEDQYLYTSLMFKWNVNKISKTPIQVIENLFNHVLERAAGVSTININFLKTNFALRFIVFLVYSGNLGNPHFLYDMMRSKYFYRGLFALCSKGLNQIKTSRFGNK